MGSYEDLGFCEDSDPIYQEGFSKMIPKKSKKKTKNSKFLWNDKSQKEAKAIADKNKDLLKNFDDTTYSVESRVDDMMKLLQEGELTSINIIIKADTNGSVEAIKDGLLKLATEEIEIQGVSF